MTVTLARRELSRVAPGRPCAVTVGVFDGVREAIQPGESSNRLIAKRIVAVDERPAVRSPRDSHNPHVLIIGVAFVVVNLVVDILAGYVDPRIRKRQEEEA